MTAQASYRDFLRTIWVLAILLGALFVVVGGAESIIEFIHSSSFDLSDRCAAGETGSCVSTQTGVMLESRNFWGDPRIAYDDGMRTMSVDLRDESIAPGTRVLIERWNGDVVSVYDVEHERRYRALAWPERWDSTWLTDIGIGAFLLAALFFPRVVRRLRRPLPVRV